MVEELPTDRISTDSGDNDVGWKNPPRIVDAFAAMVWAIAIGFVVIAVFRAVMGRGQPFDGIHPRNMSWPFWRLPALAMVQPLGFAFTR